MANITPVAFTNGTVVNGATITVPANVKADHLGVAVVVAGNLYSTGDVPSLTNWVPRVSNPSVGNQMEFNVFTRNGGVQAGDSIQMTANNSTTFAYYIVWYDTSNIGNLDVTLVGSPGGRGTTNSQYTVINGITANAGQQIIVVGSEKSSATGTNITGFQGNYTPSTDAAAEDVGGTNTSAFFGHFAPTGAGTTGTITLNYNTSSGNGVGVLLALGIPTTSSFFDPFTNPHYLVNDTPPGIWQGYLSETASPMGGGFFRMALTTDYGYAYAWEQLNFNSSTFATEVFMDTTNASFSMRLTTDGIPEKGLSFVSIGLAAGATANMIYFNERTNDPVNGPVDHVTTTAVGVPQGTPVVLRLRNAGDKTVYFDYSWDYENWINLGSRVISCFNPQTDTPVPMFQAGSPTDNWTLYANITQMNTNKFYAPAPPPWSAKTLWSYWDGTKEVEVAASPGWDYMLWASSALSVCSPTLMCSTSLMPEADPMAYPATNIYPNADYPGSTNYPMEQHPASTDYPSSTNFPGGSVYPDYNPFYPGG